VGCLLFGSLFVSLTLLSTTDKNRPTKEQTQQTKVHHRCFSRGFEETTSSTKALFVGAPSVRLLSLVGALCEEHLAKIVPEVNK
jgi:hypothetical protein